MKRVALLGATGSIGRQALEIVEAHPELELVAAASGSTPIDGLAPLTQVGGDLTELLERAEPDVVLNAVVGFAGLPATLWALERGVDLALANKESLVAAGDARARGAGSGEEGGCCPVDSEHSAAFQCLEGRAPEQVDSLVLTASGGPFRGRTRDELDDVTPEDALAHPTWSMGPKITIDSRDAREQGPRADRGALPLRPAVRPDRGRRPPDVDRARARPLPRRRGARAPRATRTCACRSRTRSPTRSARRRRCRALDLASGLTLEFHAPDLETFPLLALAREAGERGGTYPCAYNAANEVAVAAFLEGRLPFLGIAAVVEETLAARRRRAGARPGRAGRGRRRRRESALA